MRVLCRRSTRLRLAVHSFPPAPDISFLSLFRTLPQCPDPCPAFRRLSVKPIQKGFKSSDDKFRYSAAAFQNITDIDDINEVLDRDEYERYKDQRMGGLFQSKASDGAIAKSKRYEPTWYTTVEIQRIGDKHYGVTLDGVPVQARQSDDRHRLVVPSEAWAALVALEFEEALRSNGGYDLVTPHQMPMYDLASAAQQTGRMNVHERVDQLTAALETDTLLLRDAATDKRYGVQLDTVQMWFDRVMNVTTPRDLLSAADGETSYTMVGDDVLIAFKAWVQRNVSNKYSLVGLHALQGYFASPILSTAACTGVLAPDVMMKLGNADELTSVERNGFVRGYHDVRFNEMYTKVRGPYAGRLLSCQLCLSLLVHFTYTTLFSPPSLSPSGRVLCGATPLTPRRLTAVLCCHPCVPYQPGYRVRRLRDPVQAPHLPQNPHS